MQISQILQEMGGLRSIARELGISEQEAETGAAALAPHVVQGFESQAAVEPASGGGGLGALISQLGGAALLDNVLGAQPTDISRGNSLLGSIFGSKDKSREVAQQASAQSGVNPSVLKKMLPMLAMLVAGYMAKHRARGAAPAGAGGGLGNILGGLFG